jgi:hypothetical protein
VQAEVHTGFGFNGYDMVGDVARLIMSLLARNQVSLTAIGSQCYTPRGHNPQVSMESIINTFDNNWFDKLIPTLHSVKVQLMQ